LVVVVALLLALALTLVLAVLALVADEVVVTGGVTGESRDTDAEEGGGEGVEGMISRSCGAEEELM
jgi:hypothetical protein